MYPKGGACRVCGDVTHLKKDCPKLQSEKAETRITLPTLKSDQSLEGLDDAPQLPKVQSFTSDKRVNKIVKF
jgi:zinc finger CCHC domain-containing protein 9